MWHACAWVRDQIAQKDQERALYEHLCTHASKRKDGQEQNTAHEGSQCVIAERNLSLSTTQKRLCTHALYTKKVPN
jgi:hypothetical protein